VKGIDAFVKKLETDGVRFQSRSRRMPTV
jgi:hypothetical protein